MRRARVRSRPTPPVLRAAAIAAKERREDQIQITRVDADSFLSNFDLARLLQSIFVDRLRAQRDGLIAVRIEDAPRRRLRPVRHGQDATDEPIAREATDRKRHRFATVQRMRAAQRLFVHTKPIGMAFWYSMKGLTDHAIRTIDMPSTSMNAVVQGNGISGSGNIVKLFTPTGTTFEPGSP